MEWMKRGLVALAVLAGLCLALVTPEGMTALQSRTLGLVLVTLSLWGTGLVPGFLAALIFLTAVVISGLAAPEVAFSGFTSQAAWLVISGFVIGEAIRASGLGGRLAQLVGPHLGRGYGVLLYGLMALGMGLGFLMPSSLGRAVVLMPVGLALADRLGFARGSNGRIGIALTIAFGTHMPSFAILPSNIPNVVLTGMAERLYDLKLGYAGYLVLHYPVLGVLKSLVTVWLIRRFFPATIDAPAEAAPDTPTGNPRRQLWLLAVLLVTLAFWVTDSLHGIPAAWIGMATSVVLMLPVVGFLPGPAFRNAIDFGMLLFIAGAIGLGAVVNQTGLGAVIAHALASALPLAPGHDFTNFASLVGLTTATSFFTTVIGAPAVLSPLAGELAQLTGLPLQTVLMTQVVGFSTILLPYQSGPLLVAMGLSGEGTRPLLRVTLSLALITLLVLVPLDYLWWALLGRF